MTAQPTSGDGAPGMGEASRIANVFFDPKKAFTDITARPAWVVPIILMVVAAIAFNYCYTSHIGWERFITQKMESSSRARDLTADQRKAQVDAGVKFAPIIGYAGPLFFIVVGALVIGGALLLMAKMMDAAVNFKQTFAIAAYGMLPSLIFSMLAIAVMFLKNPDEFNLENPLFFNAGAFMEPPPNTGKFIYSLASSIDLFTFWSILLMATGLSVAARKFPFSKALVAVVAPWAVWVIVKAAMSGLGG